jgi:ribonuclease-3
VQARLGHRFANPSLLRQALTHPALAHHEGNREAGYERLEFLGDAVLDLLLSELLMELHPDADEGLLSRALASAASGATFARVAAAIGMGEWLRLDRGEERSGGRAKPGNLANVFESVVAALYLDGGLRAAREFVRAELLQIVRDLEIERSDPKTRLQEVLQARAEPAPEYRVRAERGPDHAREFDVEVSSGGRALGRGSGRTKREAEQAAAREALRSVEP